ncbi:TonB-dependent receptor [Pseudoduganella sp. SL102]|uniref:TonB-dependent receptor n=1 Tax=Pseudoduganella sp. SL102 TaxID=2995154 RepID=UPI00248C4460|nr:TonB-dependent receptor [Pseudoduganella sp. SL102]WBS05283.1 TonB-dependent receptor [Pseudoduganella sp. SL102]
MNRTASRPSKTKFEVKRSTHAVSLALLSLAASQAALAQQSPAGSGAAADNGPVHRVEVVATRASQQSGIERKKNAATSMDSIVAEDVGSLPDRNVGEAISRMAGIVLDRGDYGEGVTVSVRGNGADLTRVELDGQSVQSAGGTDAGATGGPNSRGTEFRQLSADLIKSVDVVKGSTADMTEGALGGGIVIKTRTGLDFKKPFASLRLGGSQNSLDKKWKPDANLILANKYLDGRLGLMLNASHSTLNNEAHSMQVSQTAQQGYYRLLDFDGSPEKTYAFLPSTVASDDMTATTPILRTPMGGSNCLNSESPLSLVTKSAGAQTKQDCHNLFPDLSPAQLALIPTNSQGPARAQRGNELLTCLNQWNDYTPSNVRYFIKKEHDRKDNLDLRGDFKVNNRLTVYAKGSFNRRETRIEQMTYQLGLVKNPNQLPNPLITPGYTGVVFADDAANNIRNAVPGSGFFQYPGGYSTRSNNYPIPGAVTNIDPASVLVDSSHHLTRFTVSDGQAIPDQTLEFARTISRYLQTGGTYRNNGLTAEFFFADARSDFRRVQQRMSYTLNTGPTTFQLDPSGLWGFDFPAGVNQADPAGYAALFPRTVGEAKLGNTNTIYRPNYPATVQPLRTTATGILWLPQIRETGERTAKLDVTYMTPDSIPFFKRIKAGFNLRDSYSNSWEGGAGDRTVRAAQGTYGTPGYVPGIYLPQARVDNRFEGCQNTGASLAPGGDACQYGMNPPGDPRSGRDGTLVLTPQEFQNIIAQTLTKPATGTSFFHGAKDRPAILPQNWMGIDIARAVELTNFANRNWDCVKTCTATDGKVYEQPVNKLKERIDAFYLMTDFGLDHVPFTGRELPFGLELDGNVGVRYVRSRVNGTGTMTFTSYSKTALYDPEDPSNSAGYVQSSIVQNTSVDASTTDVLPSLNLATWLRPDELVLRYSVAKTVARPPIQQLLPASTCIYDERAADLDADGTQRCNGTIGNPALKARKNVNQNLSLEYYPNRDTMFSLAYFTQKGKVGQFITEGVSGGQLFAGSDLVDPQTGVKLSDLPFSYSTYVNGPVSTRKGAEFSTKTAFTFLPGFLANTGFDANYTKVKSKHVNAAIVDLLTGTPLPPARESESQYNVALWYDDGRLSARVALQGAAAWFTCISPCGQTPRELINYPAQGVNVNNSTPKIYSPGSPNFKDATRFIDAKIGWKWRPDVEFFLEGRNIGNATTSNSQAHYAPLGDGVPNLLDYAYAGRRIMVGVSFRTL